MLDQIVRALAELLASIDLASDEEIDSDFAATLQGEVANVFDSLSVHDRARLAEIIAHAAEREQARERREALAEIPQAYGLRDND
ncbi:hypothetical protein [Micromonospora avicenniae]|uniref:hypothetical protein n=1 Tax=Micromonospora avicenniae TaxID=1198245 RepID=UPI00111598BE|nr:hypothetical protein [Micromonospora avicenniae]